MPGIGVNMAEKSAAKRMLTTLSLDKKYELIVEVEKGKEKKKEIAQKFNIPANTLSSILTKRDAIKEAYEGSVFQPKRKRMRQPTSENLDQALLRWFKEARDCHLPVSGQILLEKANNFAERFDLAPLSMGWVQRWRERHAITFKVAAGEANAVDGQVVEAFRSETLPALIKQYSAKDIFNCDETGFFYRLLPDRTFEFKGQECHGGKHSKERITVMVSAMIVSSVC